MPVGVDGGQADGLGQRNLGAGQLEPAPEQIDRIVEEVGLAERRHIWSGLGHRTGDSTRRGDPR